MRHTVITPDGKSGELVLGLYAHNRVSVVLVGHAYRVYVDGALTRVISGMRGLREVRAHARVAAGMTSDGETLH